MVEGFAFLVGLLVVYTLSVGLPVYVLARSLRLRQPAWALLPFGETVTLARCGMRNHGWIRGLYAIALVVALVALASTESEDVFVSAAVAGLLLAVVAAYVLLWLDACVVTGQSRWWVALMLVPLVGFVATTWIVAVRARRWYADESPVIGGA